MSSAATWLIALVSVSVCAGIVVDAVHRGNPDAIYLWCDMLNLCGDVP